MQQNTPVTNCNIAYFIDFQKICVLYSCSSSSRKNRDFLKICPKTATPAGIRAFLNNTIYCYTVTINIKNQIKINTAKNLNDVTASQKLCFV